MSGCGFSEELLSAWIDGEAGGRARQVEEHLPGCAACSSYVEQSRAAAERLRELVDAGVGEVEPLFALTRIRARIEENRSRPWGVKIARWWRDVWAYHRRAAAGVAVAMALGALVAPLVALWAARLGGAADPSLAVVVESMELAGKNEAVVYQAKDGSTTLIWVQPEGARGPNELQETH